MSVTEIRVGQIWLEDDKRFTRYIRVTTVWEDDRVTIITCDESGEPRRGIRHSVAHKRRFGKSGGYRLYKDAP